MVIINVIDPVWRAVTNFFAETLVHSNSA
jgi:hypothetical protein